MISQAGEIRTQSWIQMTDLKCTVSKNLASKFT